MYKTWKEPVVFLMPLNQLFFVLFFYLKNPCPDKNHIFLKGV